MTDFICPVCKTGLSDNGKSYICENGHCFDKAKSGYVNLLLNSGSGRHGDDKLMVRARTEFLNAGYYAPLAEKLKEIAVSLCNERSVILDAGCGEAYYSAQIQEAVNCSLIGIDISKDALIAAAKRSKVLSLAVASTAAMPVEDKCADLVLNVFSPLFAEEFSRVLKDGGYLIRVVPLEKHLWELKARIYAEPYENDAPTLELEGFELIKTAELKYEICVEDSSLINDLFMMTPYYYKTGEADQKKLLSGEKLTTQIEFGILVYNKNTVS